MVIATIAAGLATTLAPFLPTLLKGAEIAAEESVKEAVKRIWSHLAAAFGSDKGLKRVAEAVQAGDPQEEYEQALKGRLQAYLEANPGVADAIRGRADDTPVGKMVMEAINGGIVSKGKMLQEGVAADMRMKADGSGSAVIDGEMRATEGSRPKAK
jgi:hypothetical protein